MMSFLDRETLCAVLPFLLLAGVLLASESPAAGQCDRLPQCELVWADEFDGSELDSDKWEPMLGTGTDYGLPAGWGNNELQYYQAENATVADGFLTISARRESVGGREYTSARLRTMGKAQWTYGRMEMRARMPIGQGLWPAFWMLPSDFRYGGWAASGEIDIVEYLGSEPTWIHGTIHYGAAWPNNAFSQSGFELPTGTFHDELHVFAIEWEPGEIRWYVDGIHYGTQTDWFSTEGPFPAPFDVDFHLLLNLAVGGNWPGSPDSTTSFPQQLVVDYVRVYQSAAAKGSQTATTSLIYDKTVKMKKIEAVLTTTFENESRKKDTVQDGRSVSCSVRARGRTGALSAKGKLALHLEGTRSGRHWMSSSVIAALDSRGRAAFAPVDIDALVGNASSAGATVERLVVTYDGGGKKKVTHLDIDCWQLESEL